MMMNIFSSFNPLNFYFNSYFFLNCLIFNMCLINYIYINCKFYLIKKEVMNFIKNDFNKINKSILSVNLLIFIFLLNMMVNLTDMLPFSFCLNSQLNNFLFFSLMMWISTIFFFLNFSLKLFFSHLTPPGCPNMMSPFMVIIEIISILIRPITLSVRMSANLLAGHLLLHLLTEFSFFLSSINFLANIFTMLILLLLNVLELGVSIIQPYIFCTLINMYISESN